MEIYEVEDVIVVSQFNTQSRDGYRGRLTKRMEGERGIGEVYYSRVAIPWRARGAGSSMIDWARWRAATTEYAGADALCLLWARAAVKWPWAMQVRGLGARDEW